MESNPEEDHPINQGAFMPADPLQANLSAHEVRMESIRNPFLVLLPVHDPAQGQDGVQDQYDQPMED